MSMTHEDAQLQRTSNPTPNTPQNVLEQLSMKGKVVAITGAADGIGFAIAEGIAEAGGDLALLYNSNEAAKDKAAELARRHNVTARAYKMQVSDPYHVEKVIEEVTRDFGKLSCFIANAGMTIPKPLLETTLDEYRAQVAVNLDGVVYCAKYAGLVFQRQGFGNLIITSSISAHIVNAPFDQPVYNAVKAGATHLGKSLAREWRQFARVNVVSPGFFDTKMGASPRVINEALRTAVLGRQGHVKEIKGLFLYLASDASSYQTGSVVLNDGGYTLT